MLRSRKHRDGRGRRLRGLSVGKLIPNIITVSAACCGLTGIRFAIEGRWEYAVTAIIVAAILDALDGRMARILRALPTRMPCSGSGSPSHGLDQRSGSCASRPQRICSASVGM